MSERRACRGLGIRRSSLRYKRRVRADEPQLRKRILELVRKRPRFGYRRIAQLLRCEGFRASNKRVHRIWRQEGLKVPKKTREKRALGNGSNACHRHRATHANHVWSWDFIFDRTESGQTLKWFVIIDEFTRRCITLDVSRGFKSTDIIDRLSELFVMYGMPEHIRSDNGPEFIAKAIRDWLSKLGVKTLYIEPGSPWRTASPRASTVDCATNFSELSCLPMPLMREPQQRPGEMTTTITDRTVRSTVYPRRNSHVAVLLPLRLRLRSSSTATIYPFPLPKHNSHYTWTKNGGTSMLPPILFVIRWQRFPRALFAC